MTRRDFLGFFLLGGLVSLFYNKIKPAVKSEPKKAMFWRNTDET